MEGLKIEQHGVGLVATIQRGDQNSFSSEMIDALADSIHEASGDGSTRYVHIRARGKVFCTGRDRRGIAPDELRAEAGRIVGINETLRTTPLVTIAEVQGDAAGFGCGIVGACDIAVASEAARFWFPEISIGLAPTVVISWASKLLPTKQAFDMIVTGEPIDAATAVSVGLITEAISGDRLDARVRERLAAIEALDPAAVREIKRFFVHVRTMDEPSAARASIEPLVLGSLRLQGR